MPDDSQEIFRPFREISALRCCSLESNFVSCRGLQADSGDTHANNPQQTNKQESENSYRLRICTATVVWVGEGGFVTVACLQQSVSLPWADSSS